MGKKGSKGSSPKAPPPTDEELAAKVRAALEGKGLKAPELARVVGKADASRALDLARGRAASGELFRVSKGASEWFFAADPIATLDRAVPALLREKGPLPARDLKGKAFKAELERAAPGHSGVLDDWLARALGRVLFERKERAGKKTAVLLAADPVVPPAREEIFATLDRVVPELLRQKGPLAAKAVATHVEALAPGHASLLPEWQAQAMARGALFERAGKGSSKTKLLSLDPPDLKLSLGKVLDALGKALPALEKQGVTREQVLEFLRVELRVPAAGAASAPGVASATGAAPATASVASATAPLEAPGAGAAKASRREVFLEALRRFAADSPEGALLPVRELRARAGLAKQDFDSTALDLSQEGLLVLHHHDHAAALSEAEQRALVRDARGHHYVGIALRGSA